jgi:hypothetical protein
MLGDHGSSEITLRQSPTFAAIGAVDGHRIEGQIYRDTLLGSGNIGEESYRETPFAERRWRL